MMLDRIREYLTLHGYTLHAQEVTTWRRLPSGKVIEYRLYYTGRNNKLVIIYMTEIYGEKKLENIIYYIEMSPVFDEILYRKLCEIVKNGDDM